MKILGVIIAGLGVALSLATLVHDIRRRRIGREFGGPMAPKRIAPEGHAVAGLLVGVGAGLNWGGPLGCACALGFSLIVHLIVRPLLDCSRAIFLSFRTIGVTIPGATTRDF